LNYLALGDSYTIGEGVAEESRWPMQLAQALRSEGIALEDPDIIAVTGWTTDELDAYNAAAHEVCTARGVAFVDITPVSRGLGAEPAMLADDGLHPSAAMHAQWMQLALPVARRLLEP
jgi:lysophospholipase L1-like esterase